MARLDLERVFISSVRTKWKFAENDLRRIGRRIESERYLVLVLNRQGVSQGGLSQRPVELRVAFCRDLLDGS